MRGKIYLLFTLGIIVLTSQASAYLVDWTVTDNSGDGWLTAGGAETSAVTIWLKPEDPSIPLQGQITSATFSVDNDLGTFDPFKYSDSTGLKIQTKFHPGQTSGIGSIIVEITYQGSAGSTTLTHYCNDCIKIDHNTPWSVQSIQYPSELTVYTNTEIRVQMVDQYGNPVDNKKENDTKIGVPERVEFICTKTGSCFLDGENNCIGKDVFFEVNAEGYAVAPFRLSHIAGENVVEVDPVPVRPSKQWVIIYGVGEVYPWDMKVNIIPSNMEQDVGERFEIFYTLSDRYGNPTPNSPILISTNLPGDGEATVKTNEFGIAKIYYGPKFSPGSVTITAETICGLTSTVDGCPAYPVYAESTVYFVADKSIHVTANPEIMPSLVIAPGTKSEIVASLFGGGLLDGKAVRFKITGVTRTEGDSPLQTGSEPYLLVGSTKSYEDQWTGDVLTNNGKASIYFVPETLDSDPRDVGQCEIWAEYDNGTAKISDTVVVTWRNDPYPSVETYIKPDQDEYAPGQEIDVEIWVIGYGMPETIQKSVPVDVMLCISRCEQMFEDMGAEDKMVQTINVSKDFIDKLTGVSGNRFGLVTTGETGRPELFYGLVGDDEDNSIVEGDNYAIEPGHYPKYEDAYNSPGLPDLPQADHVYMDKAAGGEANGWVTMDWELQEGTIEIKAAIENITPSAYIDPAKIKPDRYGIFRSIQELVDNPPEAQTVRAVVLLTDDRKLTKYGDPDARGTWTGAKYDPASGDPWIMSDYWSKPTNGLGVLPPNYDQRWTIIPEISENPNDPNQNMAIFAGKNSIRIYVIAVPKKKQCWIDNDLESMYKSLAYTTGGEYYIACDYDQLAGAFQNISEDLRVAAAANATMEVGFVEPDPMHTLNYTAEEIFDYIPVPGPDYPYAQNKSTQILHWDWENSGAIKVFSNPENVILKDLNISHEEEWDTSHQLSFDKTLMGTIQINESWMANIRLRINSSIDEPLIFDLFSLNAILEFENPGGDPYIVNFPKIPIQINPDLIPETMNDTYINVSNANITEIQIDKAIIEWDLEYIGTDSLLTETVEVYNAYGGWNQIFSDEVPNSTPHDSFDWLIVDQPLGIYTIRITASSDDAGFDREFITIDTTILGNPPYIKLE